uniref:Peptide carrier protein n=1 Tax=uncultured bacterium AZ_379 TaxID=1630015 RepID=A0A0E3JRN6_9BACT|nr:peptide carrier protein [uncultured bacterium AZ_379]
MSTRSTGTSAADSSAPEDQVTVDVEGEIRLFLIQTLTELFESTVDADSDFFELGGDSFTAMRLISRIQASLGLELPVTTIFDKPRVAEFASYLYGMLSEE